MKIIIYSLLIILIAGCKKGDSLNNFKGEHFIKYTGLKLDVYNNLSISEIDRIRNKPQFIAVAAYYGLALVYLNGEVWIAEKELKDLDMLYNMEAKSKV
jgi:hypothetical protein